MIITSYELTILNNNTWNSVIIRKVRSVFHQTFKFIVILFKQIVCNNSMKFGLKIKHIITIFIMSIFYFFDVQN